MDTIMIDSSDGDAGSSEEDEPKHKHKHELRNPIVYTTKLNDMKIFQEDISDMDGDTIINSIIKESKPKLNRKRKCTKAIPSLLSNEDLSSHINTFNRKVARTDKDYTYSICKPVKVVLVDIKHTLLRAPSIESRNSETVKIIRPIGSDERKNSETVKIIRPIGSDERRNSETVKIIRPIGSDERRNSETVKIIRPIGSDESRNSETVKIIRPIGSDERRNSETVKIIDPVVNDELRTKPALDIPHKLKTNLIYDCQHREADMYSLDNFFFVKEHNIFPIHRSNDHIFHALKLAKNVSVVSCCCWYNREQYLTSGVIPHETLRFMRKPHKCAINLCRCCCRNKSIYVSNVTSAIRPSSLKPSESPSIWLNEMTKLDASLCINTSHSLLSKSLSIVPKPLEKKYPVKLAPKDELPYILHSTGIDFGEEYYAIGADGQIKLSLKNTGKDQQQLVNLKSRTTNHIVGNICCWFRREEFAGRLLELGALPNTVNYIRTAHLCSPKNCSCCCKPSNTEKPKLTLINKVARHTNDLVSKKVNIKMRFAEVMEKSLKPVSVRAAKKYTTKNKNTVISFNVSLSALETISMSKGSEDSLCEDVFDLLISASAKLDQNKRYVRVLVEKKAKTETVIIESKTHINDLTTYELTLLDIIFRAVSNSTKQTFDVAPVKKPNKPPTRYVTQHVHNTIYPLLLNTQLSVTTDLRSKRFLTALRAHLEKYRLPEMVNDISLWMAEAKQRSLSKGLEETKAKGKTKAN